MSTDAPEDTTAMGAWTARIIAERLCAYCEAPEGEDCRLRDRYAGECPYELDLARHT